MEIDYKKVILDMNASKEERIQAAFKLENISSRIGEFHDVLDKLENKRLDLAYIDGNHQKEATTRHVSL